MPWAGVRVWCQCHQLPCDSDPVWPSHCHYCSMCLLLQTADAATAAEAGAEGTNLQFPSSKPLIIQVFWRMSQLKQP